MTYTPVESPKLVEILEALDDAMAAYRNRLEAPRVKNVMGRLETAATLCRETHGTDITTIGRGITLTVDTEVKITLNNGIILNLTARKKEALRIQTKLKVEATRERRRLEKESQMA